MEKSAQELGQEFAKEMIQNLRVNVAAEKARRAEEKRDDDVDMSGVCC